MLSEKRVCRSCGTLLSRYNSTALCAGCTRKSGTTPIAPLWLWDSDVLRHALARTDLGAALTIIRSAMGLSQLELATVLGWSQSAVARVESGQRDTLYDVRRLVEVADALDMPRTVLLPLFLGDRDELAGQGGGGSVDMSLSRRELGGVLAGLTAAAGLSQVQIPATVDAAHVRYFRAAAGNLVTKDQSVGGGALLRDGLRLYHRARRMLDEADYSEATGHELMSAASEIASCVSWLHCDASDHATAWALCSEARLLADQAGDPLLGIRATALASLQLIDQAGKERNPGFARQAVQLNTRAAELARTQRCPELHALLAAREARAHAVLGDSAGFHRAMSRAWRELDREQRDEAPLWLRFVNRSEIAIHEARGQSDLGDPGGAAELYRTSLRAELSPRNEANYRAGLATALAAEGDLTGAVTEGTTVLSALTAGQIDSPRTVSKLAVVRRAAARHSSGAEFRDSYDELTGAGSA
ncbi:MAG: helix-turn-helix domain-containing protein [Actinomycetota bacterium]|nr:helix-turn-helix domain-containing protein [Actinomycetota bacterium]